jgi:hypothetical protein
MIDNFKTDPAEILVSGGAFKQSLLQKACTGELTAENRESEVRESVI